MKWFVEPNAARRGLFRPIAKLAAASLIATCATHATSQAVAPLATLAASEQPKVLDTIKTLVEIETGSTHRAGLDRLSTLIGDRLKVLGGEVQLIEPVAADIYRMEDTPERPEGIGRMVRATF